MCYLDDPHCMIAKSDPYHHGLVLLVTHGTKAHGRLDRCKTVTFYRGHELNVTSDNGVGN